GDLYDFFPLDSGRVFFMIGDVTGKGLPGSLFMALAKSLCKSVMMRRRADVGGTLSGANAEIARDDAEGLFVTSFAAILDGDRGELGYGNAGHEPPYVVSRDGKACARLPGSGGPPLCVVDDYAYGSARHHLSPGDALCLYTDGVTEATNAAGAFYGRDRLEALLRGLGGVTSAAELGQAIRDDVARFADGAEPADDLALLVLRWRGEPAA